jgi:hypothetical protein
LSGVERRRRMNIEKCTEENPYTKERENANPDARWSHSRAPEIGEQEDGWPCGDIIRRKCLNCGLTWKEELPQCPS